MATYYIGSSTLAASSELAALLAIAADGTKPQMCEYWKVTWDASHIHFYGGAAWQDEAPFTGIGVTVEPRIKYSNPKDPFTPLELYSSLKTDNISITLNDLKILPTDADTNVISDLFATYGSGVNCEIFYYYPQANLTVSVWFGQLQAPQIYGARDIKTVATNGYRSRELDLPGRKRPKECSANVFGGVLPDLDAVRSSLCPYDKHLGGSVGNFRTGSTPYLDCPKTKDACIARLGNNGLYFGGFVTDASPAVTDANPKHFYLASTTGNASNLTNPIKIIFGTKHVRDLQMLVFRQEYDAHHPVNSWISGIWEIGEGPVQAINNFRINGVSVEQHSMGTRLGTRGQPPTSYAMDISNFSSTAHRANRYGWVDLTNAANVGPDQFTAEADVQGFAEVCVYTDATTKTRIFSDNRVWCLLECCKNQKFGMGYAEGQFGIPDWITQATWSDATVLFTATDMDGGSRPFAHRRSTFNVIEEGRAIGDVIDDICRTGGLSVPFQSGGKLSIKSFRAFTSDELAAAPVFYDNGPNVNIIWDGEPMIELSQTPNDKVINEINISFEDASNQDTERPLTIDDPNQKVLAGRAKGVNYPQTVNKKYTAYGSTSLAETTKIGYRFLRFGDENDAEGMGGTQNNWKVKITVSSEQALIAKRHGPMKLVSSRVNRRNVGTNDGVNNWIETLQYFRIKSIKKLDNNRAEILAQAYNHTAYTAFETASVASVSSNPCTVYGAGSEEVNATYDYAGQINSKPSYSWGANLIKWTGAAWVIYVNTTSYYSSSSAVAFPWLAIWSVGGSDAGMLPVPTVVEGVPIFGGGGCQLTLGTITYDSVTGNMAVPGDPC